MFAPCEFLALWSKVIKALFMCLLEGFCQNLSVNYYESLGRDVSGHMKQASDIWQPVTVVTASPCNNRPH